MNEEGVKRYIAERFEEDLNKFLTLVGIKAEKGQDIEAEKNKYGKFVNINDLLFFAERCIEVKNVIIPDILEDKEIKAEKDQAFEEELPEVLKPEVIQEMHDKKKLRLSQGITYDNLDDEEKKKEIYLRLFNAYKVSMAKLRLEEVKILEEEGIKITWARGLKLVQTQQ